MPRGKKICPKCNKENGARTAKCLCGHIFYVSTKLKKPKRKRKRRRKLYEDVDWTTLERGQYIKVIIGSGPYWLLRDGERYPMSYNGKFVVDYLDKDGIHAYPIDKKNSGHCYIYMGKPMKSSVGVHRLPHKVKLITRTPTITNVALSR